MQTLPTNPRVVVIGTSAVGKTTFACALATASHVPFVELDELHWSPGWRENSRSEFSRLVAEVAAGSKGCRLKRVDRHAYSSLPGEVQLIWSKVVGA